MVFRFPILLLLGAAFSALLPASGAQAQLLTGYGQDTRKPNAATAPELTKPQPAPAYKPPKSRKLPKFPGIVEEPDLTAPPQESEPVDLQADTLEHNEDAQTVTASGNVFLTQSGRILRADRIAYDLKNDRVVASGHVVLNEENGDIHYSERIELRDHMKNGFIQGLQSRLADGSRFTAEEGKRENGNVTTMYDASYTPCEVCEGDPDSTPDWQIKASEVTHDEEEQTVSYKNARFELFGMPVAYTPYFSHSDGTVERKSGFLTPVMGYKSELGAFAGPRYYWSVAPDKDATFGVVGMTDENPVGFGEYRQRWDDAALEVDGSITKSGRPAERRGQDITLGEETRGHVAGSALWNMNEKWRSGADVEWASDDQYMRQYDIQDLDTSNEDVLESKVYAERFSDRDYAAGRLIAFQDVRVRERQVEQPEVLPEMVASFKGEPGAVPVIKGNWEVDTSFLGLRREGDNQDMNRLSVEGAWKRRMISDYGLLTGVRASARADAYNTRDRDVATPGSGQTGSTSETRFFPSLHARSSYPMARELENAQLVVEPIAALTVSPNIDVNNDIPNEDSQDAQIDATNLFKQDRFPGLDRIEDKSRATYGMLTGIYGNDGSRADVFLGQSYRLQDDDNPFPEGSGLNDQKSDIVGRVSGLYKDKYGLDYRFQLENKNLSSQRHEVDSFARFNKFFLSGRYLFAKELEGTDIRNSREQLRGDASYMVTDEWRLRSGAIQDMGDDPGLRKAYVGFDYLGQCISLSLIGQRNLTDKLSGESDTEILIRIGLKTLGEFAASGLQVNSSEE